jgi:hypothetical protein
VTVSHLPEDWNLVCEKFHGDKLREIEKFLIVCCGKVMLGPERKYIGTIMNDLVVSVLISFEFLENMSLCTL